MILAQGPAVPVTATVYDSIYEVHVNGTCAKTRHGKAKIMCQELDEVIHTKTT